MSLTLSLLQLKLIFEKLKLKRARPKLIQTQTHKFSAAAKLNQTQTHIFSRAGKLNQTQTHLFWRQGKLTQTQTQLSFILMSLSLSFATHFETQTHLPIPVCLPVHTCGDKRFLPSPCVTGNKYFENKRINTYCVLQNTFPSNRFPMGQLFCPRMLQGFAPIEISIGFPASRFPSGQKKIPAWNPKGKSIWRGTV